MKGRWTEVFKCHRNREDYKAQVVRLQHENQQLALENSRLKRQLAAIKDFTEKALS